MLSPIFLLITHLAVSRSRGQLCLSGQGTHTASLPAVLGSEKGSFCKGGAADSKQLLLSTKKSTQSSNPTPE